MAKIINFLKELPFAICGLILGLVSLGNLLIAKGYHFAGGIYGSLGLLLMFVVLLKVIFTAKELIKSFDDPIVSSISPTFSMALMVICVFLNNFFPDLIIIKLIWWLAVIIQFALMIYFIFKHILPHPVGLSEVYPSWFITFVGIGVISNTSPAFHLGMGQIIIWVALFLYFLLLPIIFKRIFIFKNFQKSVYPLITILTAPGSLCLAGYLTVVDAKGISFTIFLFCLSQLLYLITLITVIKKYSTDFYPSYAAYTFPLVISATAIHLFIANFELTQLTILANFELLLAVVVVSLVFIKYLAFLAKQAIKLS